MGKKGNKARQQAKKHASLDENIQDALAEDEYRSSFEKVYGKPGPPTDNVVWLGMPPPTPKRKYVDVLGRVREVDDNIPEILRAQMAQPTPKHDPVTNETAPVDKRRVTIMRDHELEYPELWMEVFVSPDPSVRDDEARFAQMFARARCSRAKSVLESDLVIFAGGSDVDPSLYGEEPHGSTCFDPKRDSEDIALYQMCVENGIPMLGVCRGAQFLHVMNGGKLYQNIDNHYGDHKMWDVNRKFFIERVSSVHHQMCIQNKNGGMEVLATNGDARHRDLNPRDKVIGPRADVEAFWYRDTCCIGVQGHPEYSGYNFFTKWTLECINELVLCSPDIEWRDGQRRVKLELLEERKHRAPALVIPAASGKKEKK